MNRILKPTLAILFILNIFSAFAQYEINQPNLRFYLSDDKSSYAGMLMVNQIWARYIQNNPDKNGVQQYGDIDLALRRSRLILVALPLSVIGSAISSRASSIAAR